MKLKNLFTIGCLSVLLGLGAAGGFAVAEKSATVKTEAAVSKTVTRVYIEDQVNSNTTLLAIESISFASGYDHTAWRSFLTSYLGARSTYDTSSGSTQPSTKGWSYMSNSEQEKYLLCPSGSKNFTMVFPEWVTALSYKAVGNNFWNWFDVNGSAVGLHSGWGIGKKVNSYIYNSGGWTMNANLDNTAQTNTWGDVTITAIASNGSSEIERKSITMSKYYKMSSQSYDIFGYDFGGWYTNIGCTSSHASLVTSSGTAYAKQTAKKVAYLAGSMNSWNASDDNYLMAPAENSQYFKLVTFAKDVEFKVVLNSNWHGWSQVDGSSKAVTSGFIAQGTDPDSTGYRIKVAVAGSYEIYIKTNVGSNMIWIQQDSESEATAYATAFLAAITCTSDSPTFALNVWNKVGSETTSMEYKYEQLTEGARGKLATASPNKSGTLIEQCAARYDRILSKYGYGTASGQRHDFMGRTPTVLSSRNIITPFLSNNSSSTLVVVAVIIGVSLAGVGGYFLLRKKKEN